MKYKIILSMVIICSLSSCCYKFPTDDDYCLVPNVNNPDITREKGNKSIAPNMGF